MEIQDLLGLPLIEGIAYITVSYTHLDVYKRQDRVGITRSVIVNALRKFESAGVIESRSLGMKGTYIKILNEKLKEELANVISR